MIIITSPNFDSENDIIKKEILKFSKKNNVYFYTSLGNLIYLSLMKQAYLVIGNSSSGILETPSFGTKTINIGNRQSGRIISKNIINCDYNYGSIKQAFNKIKKNQNNPQTRSLKKILQKE